MTDAASSDAALRRRDQREPARTHASMRVAGSSQRDGSLPRQARPRRTGLTQRGLKCTHRKCTTYGRRAAAAAAVCDLCLRRMQDDTKQATPVARQLGKPPESTATWLHRSLESHPWRLATPEAADLAYVDVDFSSLCRPVRNEERRGWVPQRQMWKALHKRDAPFMSALPLTKAVVRQQQACAYPWGPGGLPSNVIHLHEYHTLDELRSGVAFTQELISPFVISKPDFLTGLVEPPASVLVGWRARKLLVFAGHVPKLTNRPHRYLLWRQLHNDRRVTTQSHSINCTIGQFADCSQGEETLATRDVFYFQTVCHPYCQAPTLWSGNVLAGQRACVPKSSGPPALKDLRLRFESSCRPLIPGKWYGDWTTRHRLRPDYARELPHYDRDSSQAWTYESYLTQVLGHRFCLVALETRRARRRSPR